MEAVEEEEEGTKGAAVILPRPETVLSPARLEVVVAVAAKTAVAPVPGAGEAVAGLAPEVGLLLYWVEGRGEHQPLTPSLTWPPCSPGCSMTSPP